MKKSKVWTHLILLLLLIYFVLRVNLLKVLSNKYNYLVYNNNTFIHSFITFTYSLIYLFICFLFKNVFIYSKNSVSKVYCIIQKFGVSEVF